MNCYLASSLRLMCGMFLALAVVVASAGSECLAAGLIGDTVNFQCTNCFPPTTDNFIVVQGGSPELTLFDQFEVDVESHTLRINWIFDSSGIINDLQFRWSDLDFNNPPEDLVGVSIDPTSTWGFGGNVVFTPDTVTFNNNNDLTVTPGDFLLLNLHTRAIPEPASALLLAVGLAATLACRRRSR